jgi:hypothetical protein
MCCLKRTLTVRLHLWCKIGSVCGVSVCIAFVLGFVCISVIFELRACTGAKTKNNNGRLPLHVACLNQAPVEVVAALLEAHPDGEAA